MAFGKISVKTKKASTNEENYVRLEDGRKVKNSTYERLLKEAENNGHQPPKIKSPESSN
ncbi:MAG: hypothetical protein QG674_387 [Patescibacteria group bacterium]|jgi:hypothetical protein|nr:hypothetical protein [Patescibacteria group bacterium]